MQYQVNLMNQTRKNGYFGSSKNETLTANISRIKKGFDMRLFILLIFMVLFYILTKIIKPFLRKKIQRS